MAEPQSPDKPASIDPERLIRWALIACLVAIAGFRLVSAQRFTYINWGDRDLMRAHLLSSTPQTTGAELSYGSGARIPGGAQYYLMALPMLVSDDPLTSYRFMILLDTLAVGVILLTIRRTHGLWAGLFAAGTYITSEVLYDNVTKLWNPGYLPLFVAGAYYFLIRVIVDKQARSFTWMVACLGIAAQMHFSGVLLLVLFALVLVLFRTPGLLRQLPLAMVCLAVLYAPYLVYEASHDWPNTRLMFQQYQVVDVLDDKRTLRANWENVRNMLAFFAGVEHIGRDTPLGRFAVRILANVLYVPFLVVFFCAPFLWVARLIRRNQPRPLPPPQVALRALHIVLFVGLSYYVWDLNIHLHRGGSGRYLQILLPAFAGVSGIAFAHLTSWAATIGAPARRFALVLATVSIAVQAAGLARVIRPSSRGGLMEHANLADTLRAATAETGWTLDEFAGRTLLSDYDTDRGGWYWNSADSIDYLLAIQEQEWKGSLPAPCAVLFYDPRHRLEDTAVDTAFLRQFLSQDVPGLEVLRHMRIRDQYLMVVYTRAEGRCHCSWSQRYVLTPEEELLRTRYHTMAMNSAIELSVDDLSTRRFQLLLVPHNRQILPPPRIAILLDITNTATGLHVAMHSNQLRGQAYNKDYFDLAMIGRPALRLTNNLESTAPTHTLPLAHDLVGHKGVLTPLSLEFTDVPPGSYAVDFHADLILDVDQTLWPMPGMERMPVTVRLAQTLIVEGTP